MSFELTAPLRESETVYKTVEKSVYKHSDSTKRTPKKHQRNPKEKLLTSIKGLQERLQERTTGKSTGKAIGGTVKKTTGKADERRIGL